jgi:hypothetical protein
VRGARHALIEHMRCSKKLDHLIWRQKFYKEFFPQGGDRTKAVTAAEYIASMIKRYPDMEDELRSMLKSKRPEMTSANEIALI